MYTFTHFYEVTAKENILIKTYKTLKMSFLNSYKYLGL